jgi:hypothetical protein
LASSDQLEIRKQKIKGLILMALGLPGIFYLMEQADQNAWHTFTNFKLAIAAVVYFCSANFFVLGLMLLLAGLKEVPALSEPQLKRGLWMKLAGANFLAIVSALVMLDDQGAFGNHWKESWLVIPALALFVISARKGINLLRTGWKYEVVSPKTR